MSRKLLVPLDFNPPKLIKEDYIARQLSVGDVQADYEAVMQSIYIIRKTRGGGWPTSDLTFVFDLEDLGLHQRAYDFKANLFYSIYFTD